MDLGWPAEIDLMVIGFGRIGQTDLGLVAGQIQMAQRLAVYQPVLMVRCLRLAARKAPPAAAAAGDFAAGEFAAGALGADYSEVRQDPTRYAAVAAPSAAPSAAVPLVAA